MKSTTRAIILIMAVFVLGLVPATKVHALRSAWNEPGNLCGVPYHYVGNDRVFEGACPFTLNTSVEDDGTCIFFYTNMANPSYLDYQEIENKVPEIVATLKGRGADVIYYDNLQELGSFPGISGKVMYMCAYKRGTTIPLYPIEVPGAPVPVSTLSVDNGAYMEMYEIRNPFRFDNWDYYLQACRAWKFLQTEAERRWGAGKGQGGEGFDYLGGDITKNNIIYRKVIYYNPDVMQPKQLEGAPVVLWTTQETDSTVSTYIMAHDGNYILNVYSDIAVQNARERVAKKWPEGGWYGYEHTEHINWNGMTICKFEYRKRK